MPRRYGEYRSSAGIAQMAGGLGTGMAAAGQGIFDYQKNKDDTALKEAAAIVAADQYQQTYNLNKDKFTETRNQNRFSNGMDLNKFAETQNQNRLSNVSVQTDPYGEKFVFDKSNPGGSLGHIANIESGGTADPYTAKNPTSSAYGKYQVIDDTNTTMANRLNITPGQARTPQGQEAVMGGLDTEYSGQLKHLGKPNTNENKYVIHQLGYPRAERYFNGTLTQEDKQIMDKNLPENMRGGDVVNSWTQKYATPSNAPQNTQAPQRWIPANVVTQKMNNGDIVQVNKVTGEQRMVLKGTGAIPTYSNVKTNDGVFMVNSKDPSQKVRLGDAPIPRPSDYQNARISEIDRKRNLEAVASYGSEWYDFTPSEQNYILDQYKNGVLPEVQSSGGFLGLGGTSHPRGYQAPAQNNTAEIQQLQQILAEQNRLMNQK